MANMRSSILPAGTLAPVAELADGTVEIKITNVQSAGVGENDGVYVNTKYPDGWSREHHVFGHNQVGDIITKIVNNLRARYGVESVVTVTTPTELVAGAVIKMEVKNS